MKTTIIGALSTYRLTKLIIDDVIFNEVRETLLNYLDDNGHRKMMYLMQCPWCISMYSGLLVSLVQKDHNFRDILLNTLTYSAVSGIIDSRLNKYI